jgi:hypothetical protein
VFTHGASLRQKYRHAIELNLEKVVLMNNKLEAKIHQVQRALTIKRRLVSGLHVSRVFRAIASVKSLVIRELRFR